MNERSHETDGRGASSRRARGRDARVCPEGLASVFASLGGYENGQAFTDGMNPALLIGAGVVALGAFAAFLMGRPRRAEQVLEPLAEAA